ncbi:MAG: MBL fold metallo-hydrolase [Dehalococcoidia bacterium]
MQQLTANVFVEVQQRGANHGLVVTSEGVVLIDTPQKPTDALLLRQQVVEHGPVRFIINTEPHLDHWTGNAFFEAPIIAHTGVRQRMVETDPASFAERAETMGEENLKLMRDYTIKLPTITYTDRLTLRLGDHTFECILMPGHTPFQSAVFIPEERVVFTSDNVFCRVQTFLHEAVPDLWLKSLEELRSLEADILVPGHGETCGKDYLDEQAAFIREWLALVRDAFNRGMSKEEAMEQLSLLDRYPMDVEIEYMGPMVMQRNVSRLYDLLASP